MIFIDIQYEKICSVTPEKYYSKSFYNFLKDRTFCDRPVKNPIQISLPTRSICLDLKHFYSLMPSVITL